LLPAVRGRGEPEPDADDRQGRGPAAAEHRDRNRPKGVDMAKVLVVDDSLSVRKVVERALIGRQIEVVCAATGTEALERFEHEAPDLVVCDVVMPDRDGYEICEFVKRHPRLGQTPVLLMSGIV